MEQARVSHLISLAVGTVSAEDHAETFDGVTNYAKMLAAKHGYVNVSSELVGEDETEVDEDFECAFEHLRHDEETLNKVRVALTKVVSDEFALADDAIDTIVNDMINEMQNAGILFRERGPVETSDES